MKLSNVILQTSQKMQEVITIDQAHEFSIHTEFNFFWKFKDFNIYEATVSDRMHISDINWGGAIGAAYIKL